MICPLLHFAMSQIYHHVPSAQDVGPEGRSYQMTEGTLEYRDRLVLYVHVVASDISFCDRNYAPHMASVNVKGYVVHWKHHTGDEGEEISKVEPITDSDQRHDISRVLRERFGVASVSFV